jgi:oligosaccharide repeat unit polymerase
MINLDQLYSICLALIIIMLTVPEVKRLNSIITPFTFSAWPFLVICLLNNFILVHFKFKPVTARAQLFILVNLVIIWVVGSIMYHFLYPVKKDYDSDRYKLIFKDIVDYQYLIILIAWITIILNFNRAINLLSAHGGILFLGDQRFEDQMSGGGGDIVGHIVEVGKICYLLLIFTISFAKNKFLYFVTIIALLLSTALTMVKYHVMWLVLFTFLFFIINKPVRKQVKTMAVVIMVLFLVMNLFWVSMTLVWGTFSFENKEVWNYFVQQTFNYFVSGPIVLDKWLTFGDVKPDWVMFLVLLNIKNVLVGNPERIIAVPYVCNGFYDVAPHSNSNVGTAFGVYYLIGGYIFAFFMVTVISIVSYIIYYKNKTSKSKILVFLNLLLLTLNTYNFFAQYFTLFTIYEITIIFVMFVIMFKVLNMVRRISRTVK